METLHISLIAGFVSSSLFMSSHVPMLVKALRTRDLSSYSFANLALTNLGNSFYWLYITTLPFGPIWILHGFYTLVAALMLAGYLRYASPSIAGKPASRSRKEAYGRLKTNDYRTAASRL